MDDLARSSSLVRAKHDLNDQDDYVNIIFDENSEVFNRIDLDERKRDYYKSNPLRNYAPTKGQSMLPQTVETTNGASSTTRRTLPNIIKELRDQSMENFKQIEIDRTLYKYKLKADLKVSLSSLENTSATNSKIRINGLRGSSSKKSYDYLRSSISKQNESRNLASQQKPSTSDTIATHASFLIDQTPERPEKKFISQSETTFNKPKQAASIQQAQAPAGIDAKSVRINTLDEIVDEIKSKNKYKSEFIASVNRFNDNTQNQDKDVLNNKYYFNENYDSFLNNVTYSMDEIELQANAKGVSMYSYKNQPKKSEAQPRVSALKEQIVFNEPSYAHLGSAIGVRNNTEISSAAYYQRKINTAPKPSAVGERMSFPNDFYRQEDFFTAVGTNSLDNFDSNLIPDDRLLSANSKYKKRVREAREKVMHIPVEKQNLNKITIIQPFEETKILINLNKVPTKVLNKIFNKKEGLGNSYVIPPVKAFGFLTKKVSDSGASSISTSQIPTTQETSKKIKKHKPKKNSELFNDAAQNSFIIAKYVPPELVPTDAKTTHTKVSATKKLEVEAISTQ